MAYLLTFRVSLAAHVMENMPANMQSHIPKNVLLPTNQTGGLRLPLQDPRLVSRNEVADDEMLLVQGGDEIKALHNTRSDAVPSPDR